jgi:hypothetical protein
MVMLPVAGRTLPGTPVSGIYEVTAFVPNLSNRLFALQMILIGGIPTLIGLGVRCLASAAGYASNQSGER